MFVNHLQKAAITMLEERDWLCIPLTKDANGYPKVPMTKDWTNLQPSHEVVMGQPWDRAEGLGIVLGPKSRGLAVIDVDDQHLGSVIPWIVWDDPPHSPRIVQTARKRLHVYLYETHGCTSSRKYQIEWQGRDITVELKTTGTQVAAPPSPGYTLLNQNPVWEMGNLDEAWELILDFLKAQYPQLLGESTFKRKYPIPWQDDVAEGERDDSAFIEACRLRESGMPVAQAMDIMRYRFDKHYQQDEISWREIERTVQSAYNKPVIQGRGGVEL